MILSQLCLLVEGKPDPTPDAEADAGADADADADADPDTMRIMMGGGGAGGAPGYGYGMMPQGILHRRWTRTGRGKKKITSRWQNLQKLLSSDGMLSIR